MAVAREFVSDIPAEIDPMMMVVLQHPRYFQEAVDDADRWNYLFRLSGIMFSNRLNQLGSPGTANDYLCGVRTYQVISTLAFPDQPRFTVFPDERAAFGAASRIGAKAPDQLIDVGLARAIDLSKQVPLLTETAEEIAGRYVTSQGSLCLAMAGVAMMHSAHVEATELLDELLAS